MTETPRVRVGVGVVVVRHGRVLLGRRLGSHGAGEWALPGGHLDFGETLDACAARELAEETGMTVTGIRPATFTVDLFPDEHRHYVTLFVEAVGVDGDPATLEPEKCAGWEWFPWTALPTPLFRPLASLVASGYVPADLTAPA